MVYEKMVSQPVARARGGKSSASKLDDCNWIKKCQHQGHLSLEPGQKWKQTHVYLAKLHLYTMFLVPSTRVKSLCLGLSLNVFVQLSRIMAFKSGKKEWIIILYRRPDLTISLANVCDAFQGSYTDTFVSYQLFTYLVNNLNVLECAYYKITAFVL